MNNIKMYYIKHKQIIWTIFVQLIFVIMSLILTLTYLRNNFIDGNGIGTSDIKYHLQQCIEIIQDFKHFKVPSFNNFDGIRGLAESTFYPWTTFIPIIIGLLIHVPLSIIMKINVILTQYILMNTIYYASRRYWKNKNISFLIAIMYPVSYTIIQGNVNTMDISVSFGTSAMVLSIFGYFYWIKNNKWKMLTCGMIFLCYTSFVLGIITLITLVLLSILNFKGLSVQKIKNGIKAIIITLCCTISIWLPLLVISKSNKLYTPVTNIVMDNKVSILKIMTLIVSINPINLLFLITSYCLWNHLSKQVHNLLIIIVFYIFLQFGIIPFSFIQYTPFALIQYLIRLVYVINLFILIATIPILVSYCTNNTRIISSLLVIGLTILFIVTTGITLILSSLNLATKSIHTTTPTAYITKKQITANRSFESFNKQLKNNSVSQQYYLSEFLPKSTLEYYGKYQPKSMIKISSIKSYKPNIIMQEIGYKHHTIPINQGISINNKSKHTVRIPIILYHGQKYDIYEDGKQIRDIKYSSHEPIIKQMHKGHHIITFTAPYMWYRILANIISLSSISIFAGYSLKERKKCQN